MFVVSTGAGLDISALSASTRAIVLVPGIPRRNAGGAGRAGCAVRAGDRVDPCPRCGFHAGHHPDVHRGSDGHRRPDRSSAAVHGHRAGGDRPAVGGHLSAASPAVAARHRRPSGVPSCTPRTRLCSVRTATGLGALLGRRDGQPGDISGYSARRQRRGPDRDRAYAVISSQGCGRVAQGRTADGSWVRVI